MVLSEREFLREAAKRALHSAWHISHVVHLAIILIVGAGVVLGIHFKEHPLIWFPFAALLVVFFGVFLHHAYQLYLEAETARKAAEDELSKERSDYEAKLKQVKLEIVKVESPQTPVDGGFLNNRIQIKNVGSVTAKMCGVSLSEADPPLSDLPLRLQCTNQKTNTEHVDLAPGEIQPFDVCRMLKGSDMVIWTGACHMPMIPINQGYKITLSVRAEGMSSFPAYFAVSPQDGVIDFRQVLADPVVTSIGTAENPPTEQLQTVSPHWSVLLKDRFQRLLEAFYERRWMF